MKLVMLDRDGVINHDSPHFVKSPQEWRPLLGSLEAIRLLNECGMLVAVITNQSGIARGLFSLETLDHIHQTLHAALAQHHAHVDGIFYCPHGPNDACACRKPKPGLLMQALKHFSIAPQQAYMVGDSMRDIHAAIAAQCQPILVLTGNGEKTWAENKTQLKEVPVYTDLMMFVQQSVVQ